uniref:GP-PDE domain-containing protein n=1 Tax=Caenorhabditis tropicalis TaxID=1561998 RepID=A0A1I7TWI7_9PELO
MTSYSAFPEGATFTEETMQWRGRTPFTPFEVYRQVIDAIENGIRHIIISDDFVHLEAVGIALSFLNDFQIVSREELFIRLDLTMYKDIGVNGFLIKLRCALYSLQLDYVNILVAHLPLIFHSNSRRRQLTLFPARLIWSLMIIAIHRRKTIHIGISNWTRPYIYSIISMRTLRPHLAIFNVPDREAVRYCYRLRIPLCINNQTQLIYLVY